MDRRRGETGRAVERYERLGPGGIRLASLRLNDLVGDAVVALEPGDDLACAGVIDIGIPLAEAFLLLAQAVESDVLERQEVLADAVAELRAEDLTGCAAEGLAIIGRPWRSSPPA